MKKSFPFFILFLLFVLTVGFVVFLDYSSGRGEAAGLLKDPFVDVVLILLAAFPFFNGVIYYRNNDIKSKLLYTIHLVTTTLCYSGLIAMAICVALDSFSIGGIAVLVAIVYISFVAGILFVISLIFFLLLFFRIRKSRNATGN